MKNGPTCRRVRPNVQSMTLPLLPNQGGSVLLPLDGFPSQFLSLGEESAADKHRLWPRHHRGQAPKGLLPRVVGFEVALSGCGSGWVKTDRSVSTPFYHTASLLSSPASNSSTHRPCLMIADRFRRLRHDRVRGGIWRYFEVSNGHSGSKPLPVSAAYKGRGLLIGRGYWARCITTTEGGLTRG